MCILFSYISRKCINPGEFKLVILSNRDEYFHRPSKPACFVNDFCLYGQDMTTGKEGGTWLGMNKYGKISALLNLDKIDYADDDLNKAGRGFISFCRDLTSSFMIPNYLSNNFSSTKYVDMIKPDDKKYNPFNLVFYEKNQNNGYDVSIFDNYSSRFDSINSEFFSISNHLYDRPYPKTINGEKLFKNIINQLNKADKKHELLNKLFDFAKYDAEIQFKDVIQKGENAVREMMREQVYIEIPNYGTRTHSIILVDHNNKVTYHEKTLAFPIDEKNKQWEDSVYEFELL